MRLASKEVNVGCSFRFNNAGVELRLVVQWAILVAALRRLLMVVRVVLIFLVTTFALLNASGAIPQLKALFLMLAQLFS